MTPDTPDLTLSQLTRPSGPAPSTPKRRVGLVVGLAASCAVLLAGVAVLATVLVLRDQPSTPQAGQSAPATHGPNNGIFGGTTGTVIQPAIPPDTYSDADELVEWLTREGLACGEVDHVDGPTAATSMIDCGPDVVAAVYADHAHAVRGFETLVAVKKQMADPHVYMAIGENWTVNGDEAYAKRAADRLGGEFRSS